MCYDIIVIGAGHAGCEAALAAARMGARTLVLTTSLDTIAKMPCNPAIGGLAKGQLVREIDALGGEMGKAIDATGIQFRMLNTRKGPAVRSPRAQADKHAYSAFMRTRLECQPGLTVVADMAVEIVRSSKFGVRSSKFRVRCASGREFHAQAVILATGTFLNGLIHVGTETFPGGRDSEPPAIGISDSLRKLGFNLGRLKTGTPPRIHAKSIDYSRVSTQPGDRIPQPFSFSTERIDREQIPCYITYTNPTTHEIIRSNLDRAPLYTGQIKSVGPRYCPSIETKIVRFADKDRHQIFLEPEGRDDETIYCNGISTSIPRDVQDAMVHSIEGLEKARILRYGYAIEYDYAPPTQLLPSLETKLVPGLFFAGQINGTSGYEEAAAQGIMAGINAVLHLRGEQPFILGRDEAYIGVMIDDLVTRGVTEPYRMFTSRAEYRLILRQDNADRRLMKYGYRYGLIPETQWRRLCDKEALIAETLRYLARKHVGTKNLAQLLKRPETPFEELEKLDSTLAGKALPADVKEQVAIELKYEGYLQRQAAQIARFRELENLPIPAWVDYGKIPHLRAEAREKLEIVRPVSLGQAARVSGVSPADVSILMVWLRGKK